METGHVLLLVAQITVHDYTCYSKSLKLLPKAGSKRQVDYI